MGELKMEGKNINKETDITPNVNFIGREKTEGKEVNLGDAYFSSPIGKIVVTKEGDGYDTDSKGVAHIPEIGDVEISMYYAEDYLNRILIAHKKIEIPTRDNHFILDYYDPRKKCFVKIDSSESEIKPDVEKSNQMGESMISETAERKFWESI